MANIDLNKTFIKNFSTSSPVDSEIALDKPVKEEELFSDYKLDLQLSSKMGEGLYSSITERDIAKIKNEEAILQSLRNLLNTKYQSRLLNPEINFDLRSYLFENLTQSKAFFIGYDISTFLPIYEPRVMLNDISVVAYYNSDTYGINMSITIPSINKNVTLSSILDSNGFTFS